MRFAPGVLSVLVASATLLAAKPARAQEWPQWRGPERNGLLERSPALVNSFGGGSPTWRSEPIASGERGGRGSLVAHDRGIYGLTSTPSQGSVRDEVFCLDADTGKTRWRSPLSEPGPSDVGSSTPCIVDGRLYVIGSGRAVYCLNAETGDTIWESVLDRASAEPIASSVAVVDRVAVVLADVLTGLSADTGQVLWTQEKITGRESSPARWSIDGKEFVVCNSRLETHCVDPMTGEILWTVPGGGRSTPVVAQEYGGDFLVNMSGSRRSGLSAYRLSRDGCERLWTMQAFDRAASPVVYNGHVYAIAGGSNGHGARILCVHVDTGTVAWEEIIDFAEVSSPVVVDGKLAAVCGTFLWLLEATPERYIVLSQADCQITLCTSPTVSDGRLYLRQSNAVVCYDLRSAQ